jgi:hypothetical protein
MTTRLTPYLNFREGARGAMEFYQSVFGGDLTVSTFGDTPGMGLDEAEKDKVLHSMLVVGPDMTLMAADVPDAMPVSANGTLTLRPGRGPAAPLLGQALRRRHGRRAAGEGALGRRIRHVHRPIRRRLDGQHRRRRLVSGSRPVTGH